jgi:SAM-dependent methyltransferase
MGRAEAPVGRTREGRLFINSGPDDSIASPDVRLDMDELRAFVRQHRHHLPSISTRYRGAPKVLDLSYFGIRPDSVIADIGSGTGALAVRLLAEKVAFGKLIEVDINPVVLDVMKLVLEEARPEGHDKVELLLSRPDDVAIAPGTVDIAIFITPFLCDEATPPVQAMHRRLLRSLGRALKPGGLVHLAGVNTPGVVGPAFCPLDRLRALFDESEWEGISLHTYTPLGRREGNKWAYHMVFRPRGKAR